jgi:sugar/nucleoside kinase (ribokinase family)
LLKRLGVIGSMVWDTIHGRDPAQPAVEEWGGIAYALAALDATLQDNWQLVPLIKVGRDLAPRANEFLRTLRHVAPGTRFIEVPEPNNRVTLRYDSAERRCEQMQGGVPPWTWPELGPMVQDLDALYVNFISGFELSLETAQLLRRGFPRFVYADLHSLFLGKEADGTRVIQPLPQAPAWFGCFDAIQLNEEEMRQLGNDPLATAADALGRGCTTLCVTLGSRGAAYFEQATDAETGRRVGPIRTARIPPDDAAPLEGDPTGCGDVFGGAVAAGLVRGASLEDALREGTRLAGRNLAHRGASGLRDHLLGRLSTV